MAAIGPPLRLPWRTVKRSHDGSMLRRVLFAALVLTPWAVGVASEGASTPMPWAVIPTQGTIISLIEDDGESYPTKVTVLSGRAALRVLGNEDQRLLVRLGDIVISVQEGHILIDQNSEGCFVVVVAGFALIRDSRAKDRGILLQSRQGIAAKPDGTLADVLTFSRVPRLEDPEPLALQALAEEDEQDWPMDVAAIERNGIQEPMPTAIVVASGEPTAPPATDPPEALADGDPEPVAATVPEPVEPPPDAQIAEPSTIPVPEAPAETLVEVPAQDPVISPPWPLSQPAWMHRGRL